MRQNWRSYRSTRAASEVARFTLADGDRKKSCETLSQVRTVIVGLGDADLRKKLNEVYVEA